MFESDEKKFLKKKYSKMTDGVKYPGDEVEYGEDEIPPHTVPSTVF
jgi:hypothetical protein